VETAKNKESRIQRFVFVRVKTALPLLSPAYNDGSSDELSVRRFAFPILVFHCLFSLVPPVVIFYLTSRPQYPIMFANVLTRCILFRKGCILRTEPGGVPDA